MIRFSKLRLTGFKSFVEPSEFAIEKGLTGVVGPNGCGKSNLVEALRWVMGENSYKNMRASGMEDVIFSGSGTRPSRNSAEVQLYLDNRHRTAPAAFNNDDELQVSRRIERDKGSTYRINGKEARAKDVQLLFADQSTGARSPSMVGQGKVGELIQAKPQARRALLEEAAGIAGLHTRRHEAELRLRAAEQNLERLDDVTAQLASQIESLKRQARQAIRFKGLSEEMRAAEATLMHIRWSEAKAQQGEAESLLAKATSLVGSAAAAQMDAAKAQAIGASKLPALRDTEAAAAAAMQRITIAQEQLEDEARRNQARRVELAQLVAQLEADIAREERLIGENAAILERLAAEDAALKAEDDGTAARQDERRAAMEAAAEALAVSEKAYQARVAERAEAEAHRAALTRAEVDARDRVARAAARIAALTADIAAVDQKLAALPDRLEKQSALDAALAALDDAERAVHKAEETLETARKAEELARPVHAEARATLDRIETEARTLNKLVNAKSGGLFAPVLERLTVDRGYETALGAALGEDLDLPTDPNAAAHWAGAGGAGDPALPDGAEPLATHVRGPSELARRLAQVGIVADRDTGNRLAASLSPGQRLVARDGTLWRWDGLRVSAEAPSAAAIRLEQKNRLAELEIEARDAKLVLRDAEEHLQQARNAVERARDDERNARQAVRDRQGATDAARRALAEAERLTGEIATRREGLKATLAQIEAQKAEGELAREDAVAALAALADTSSLADALRDAETALAEARLAASESRAAHDAVARENEARRSRIAAIAAERDSWTRRSASASDQVRNLGERAVKAKADLAALDEAPDDIAVRRRELSFQRERLDRERKAAGDALAEAESRQRIADEAANAAVLALASAREERARAEERATAAETRRKEIEERIRESLRMEPHEVFSKTGLDAGAALPKPVDIERQIERLRVERERLGAVNLRAEEEQQELTVQLETLNAERDDVIEAIRKLRLAIQTLNREGRERLLAAFEEVNGHFKTLFSRLFGGGMAELQLVDAEDPLDAGLEILARPPGKRPQTMTLLSGGEQALTAMALIFAVFLTNPAPICVLDEVDAPLDDHNVERFCDLMDEMVKLTETRFVIITHNPITMARMDRLFGVTMAEQGVSQLVSVDLQTAEALREAS